MKFKNISFQQIQLSPYFQLFTKFNKIYFEFLYYYALHGISFYSYICNTMFKAK